MLPRSTGTLTRWIDERGFGFITPNAGSEEVFVHLYAFPRGTRPEVGMTLSYELETTPDGRKRAVRVRVAGQMELEPRERTRRVPRPRAAQASGRLADARRPQSRRPPRSYSGRFLALVLAGAAAASGWIWQKTQVPDSAGNRAPSASTPESGTTPARIAPESRHFQCDGRIYCSQMTSCAEAKFFLRNCPGTKMDGNHDGTPCESQWCG